MRDETSTILNDLAGTELFRSTGKPVDDENVIVLKSWQEAIKSAERVNWENIRLDWGNSLSVRLAAEYPVRFQRWNDVTVELKTLLLPIIDGRIAALALNELLERKLRSNVRWDLLSLLIESEFADLVPPHYYAALGVIYFDGHFPCGWEGEYPNGKLIVY